MRLVRDTIMEEAVHLAHRMAASYLADLLRYQDLEGSCTMRYEIAKRMEKTALEMQEVADILAKSAEREEDREPGNL